MKILIAADTNIEYVSGSTSFSKRLASLLKDRGHEFAFLCPGRSASPDFYAYNGFEIFGMPSFPSMFQKTLRLSRPFFIKEHIRKVLKEYRPDIVHIQSHGSLPAMTVKMAQRMKIRVIATNHFVPENFFFIFRPPKWLEPMLCRLMWKYMHRLLNRIEPITVPTNAAAKLLKESGIRTTIKVISNGIDLAKFNIKNQGKYLHHKYNIPDKPILLFVGRLDPEKNIEVLIHALPKILHKIDAHLVIVGTGKQDAALKKRVSLLHLDQQVSFTGLLPDGDLPHIYRIAQCFVMPGTVELQSIVTMEAMASGLPIVAANSLALPELVCDGKNGYLFPSNDSDALAERVIQILSDSELRNRMAQASLEMIQQQDIHKTMDEFEALYLA